LVYALLEEVTKFDIVNTSRGYRSTPRDFYSIVIIPDNLTGGRKKLMSTDKGPAVHWSSGDAYERYVGRWSRIVAREFIHWLGNPQHSRWLDVGSGTGALSQTIIELANPASLKGIDRSESFVRSAQSKLNHPHVEFETGDAAALPVGSESFDVAVSGLVLNFIPQPDRMVDEMKRAVRAGGTIALYVWDYASRMQFMRHFWNAAAALDPAAHDLDEGRKSPICDPVALQKLFQAAGLTEVETQPIDIATTFQDFDDFWAPFLGGQGPAPSYLMSLSEEKRNQLRDRLYNSLPFALDGTIPLIARVWAIKGVRPIG
jgi:ubiquinone/menaquinone biosynthesis C-methylase UbiE